MSEAANLRILLLPHQGVRTVLPHAAVSEIISHRQLDDVPEEAGIPWALGMTSWFGFRVPVISAEKLLDKPYKDPGQKAKIAICNLLNGDNTFPAVGISVEAIPRLFMLENESELLAAESDNPYALSALYKAEQVWVLDLDAIGQLLNERLA